MSVNDTRFCVCLTPDGTSSAGRNVLGDRRAALADEYRWRTPIVRVLFLDGDHALRVRIRRVAEEWTAPGLANLTWDFVSGGHGDVRIGFRSGCGSWSYLGTFAQTIRESAPTMNFGWLTPASSDKDVRAVVLHEFGHALGLIHEHQNPKHPIQWNEPALLRDLSGAPNYWNAETIRRNVIDHYDAARVVATNVDRASIMMYPIPASWTVDGFSAGINADLSPQDRAFIRRCYP